MSGPAFGILNRIAYCESHWHPQAKNPTSTASGLFQFLATTWQKYGVGSVFDPYANIDAAVALYNTPRRDSDGNIIGIVGTAPWYASKSCWGSSDP